MEISGRSEGQPVMKSRTVKVELHSPREKILQSGIYVASPG